MLDLTNRQRLIMYVLIDVAVGAALVVVFALRGGLTWANFSGIMIFVVFALFVSVVLKYFWWDRRPARGDVHSEESDEKGSPRSR